MLVETPSFYLVENFRKFLLRNRLVNEAFAAPETAEVPWTGFKLGWHRVLPQRQIFRQIGLERPFRAVECAKITTHNFRRRSFGNPPKRMECVLHDLPQAELLCHGDLRRQ